MNIKKNFQEIHSLLLKNVDSNVGDILSQLEELMESKQRDSNDMEDSHGLWIFCYYHKEWELVKQVEYGSKVNTSTGLNTMCKVGVNQWTKQQRDFKEEKSNLLEKVMSKKILPEDLQSEIDKLEEVRLSVKPLKEFHEELAHQFAERMMDDMHEEALKMNEE